MSTSAKRSDQPAFGLKLPDRYRVSRHIATGGMASVWCAEDRVLGRAVAIKVLSERFGHDELAVRRFKREARAAARVSGHPHVVTIFDVGDIEPADNQGAGDAGPRPRAFIVMEHLAGGTVADALRSDTVRRAEARRWLREAASALDHAHARGIVHRDIKPANFLLDRERALHVADFGIARLQSEDTITSSGELFGTAAYLAPEQALGRDATSASDRYALAVAAFELLTGGRPFTASHFAVQARQHIEDEPPRASERDHTLPPAVDEVLARGMAKDPAARFPTAGAFVEALEASLDGAVTASTRVLPRAAATRATPPRAAARPAAMRATPPRAAARVPAARATPPRAGTGARTAPGRARPAIPTPVTRPAPSGRRPRGRAAPVAALAAVALGIVLLLTQLDGGSGSARHASGRHRGTLATGTSGRRRAETGAAAKATTSTASSGSATNATAVTSAAAALSTTAPAASASALQLQGHQEMLAGSYPAAIETLRHAVAAAPGGSLTYAYALYDLGRSLLLSGDAKAAVGVLEQRLKIPNQTPVVQETLNQALRASGLAPAGPSASGPAAAQPNPAHPPGAADRGSGGAGIPPGSGHGKRHHGGG